MGRKESNQISFFQVPFSQKIKKVVIKKLETSGGLIGVKSGDKGFPIGFAQA